MAAKAVLIERTVNFWRGIPIGKVDDEDVKYLWENAFADVNETVDEITKTVLELEDLDELVVPLRQVHKVCLSWIEEARKNVNTLVEDESSIDASLASEGSNMSFSVDGNTTVMRRSLQSCSDDSSCNSVNSNDASNEVQRNPRPEGTRCELWSLFEENNLPVPKSMALLYILLRYGNGKPISTEKKEVALLSGRIYFGLLRIPGSRAFRIFQSNIFTEVLNTLKIPKENAKSKKKQAKNKKKRGEDDFEEDIDGENNNAMDNEADGTLDVARLLPIVKDVILDLGLVLESFPLKSHPLLLENATQLLVTFTNFETEANHHSNTSMSQVAYQSLLAMCNSSHGAIHMVCCTIMRHLLPNVLMTAAGSAQTIQKQYQVTKEKTVEFLKRLIRTVGEEALPAARIFLQHLSTKSPDRAEFRTKIAQSIISLLECFPLRNFDDMIEWFHKLNRTARINNRVFTLELFSLMIVNNGGSIQLSSEQYKATLRAVMERCSDKSPSVKSKALAILAQYFASVEQEKNGDNRYRERPSGVVQSAIDLLDDDVIEMLHERCCDARVHVRKSAIQVLEQVMCLDPKFFTEKSIDLLKELCRDVGLLARKQALQSLTSCLLYNPTSREAQKYWVMGVLPMIVDREASIQEKCLETMEMVLLQNLSNNARPNVTIQEMSFQVVGSIADGEQQGYQPYLQTVIKKWAQSGKVKPNIIASIRRLIGGPYDGTAWLLLAELSSCLNVINNPSFVFEYWEENKKRSSSETLHRVLQTILHSTKCAEKTALKNLYEDLLENLTTFNIPPELISISVDIVHNIDERLNKISNRRSRGTEKWFSNLLNLIKDFLSRSVTRQVDKLDPAEEETFVCHLFTLGVLSQISGIVLPKNLYCLVQTIVACSCSTYQLPLSELVPSQMSASQVNLAFITLRIKAYAYTTLGKLCLRNEDFAKQNIVPLVKELQLSKEETIRNNILIIMSDLCVRYPTLVDPYVNNITACLRDPSVFVRKQVLTLLVHLLQEDYIKCRGSLFYRMLVAYIDESPEVRELAEFALMHILPARNPNIFSQHFVECIFFLNFYTEHRTYNKFAQTETETKLFALSGVDNQERRAKLYKFMLASMDDDQKFLLNLRICQEILAAVTDEVIPLSKSSEGIIKDALGILCCDEIKLSSMTSTQDEVEDDMIAAVAMVAKRTIISHVVKKNVIENIVPIVVSLKRLFEKNNSPLLRDLMFFLRELLKDYKNEVKEILSDKQLAKEIEFDMRRFSEEEEKRRQAEARLLEARAHENQPNPVDVTPARIPAERTSVPFKAEINSQSARILRPNDNLAEVVANRRATLGGPMPLMNLDKKPQVCLERTMTSVYIRNHSATASNESVCEINTASIKRTASCDEVPVVQRKRSGNSRERVEITLSDSTRKSLSPEVQMSLQTQQPVLCLERLENTSVEPTIRESVRNEDTVVQNMQVVVSLERLGISALQRSRTSAGAITSCLDDTVLQNCQPQLGTSPFETTLAEPIKRTISCNVEMDLQTTQPVVGLEGQEETLELTIRASLRNDTTAQKVQARVSLERLSINALHQPGTSTSTDTPCHDDTVLRNTQPQLDMDTMETTLSEPIKRTLSCDVEMPQQTKQPVVSVERLENTTLESINRSESRDKDA